MNTKTTDLTPYFDLAIRNISKMGDTDIFPFPIENHVLHDRREEIVNLLETMFKDFDGHINTSPPKHLRSLVPVGQTGFRFATQMDPLWNAYFLALVLYISDEIESDRVPIADDSVFSYRIDIDNENATLFQHNIGYREFLSKSRELSTQTSNILLCDISDCYSRVGHHMLESALQQIKISPDIKHQILEILKNFTGVRSFGLPIGGPAARILVELVLGQVDKLLKQNSIKFCRFVDDYHIFVQSESEAYNKLLFISDTLIRNQGLTLQKSKTRIMTGSEFINIPDLFEIENDEADHPFKGLLSMSLRFDPYSPNAEEDYEQLKDEVKKIDLIQLLNMELAKSRIHQSITKRIITAIKLLSDPLKNDAVLTVISNLNSLYSIFPTVAQMIIKVFEELNDATQEKICDVLRKAVAAGDPMSLSDANQSYIIRILSRKPSPENLETLVSIYNASNSQLVRKDIIIAMANMDNTAWLTNLKSNFDTLNPWERRGFILASYKMADEGKHWRDHNKKNFTKFEMEIRNWAVDMIQKKGQLWRLPL